MKTPDGTTYGKTATVSCDKGYILSGDGNIKCEASGTWGRSSTCIPKGYLSFIFSRNGKY